MGVAQDLLDDPQVWEQASLDTDDQTDFAGQSALDAAPPEYQAEPPAQPAAQTPPPVDPNVAAQAQPAQQVADQLGFKDYLVNNLGLQGLASAADDQAAAGMLVQSYVQQQQQAQQTAQQLQYLQYEVQRLRQASQQAAAPVAAPEPVKPKWERAPEWDHALERFLTRDDKGNIVAINGADPSLPQRYEAYRAYERGLLNNLGQKGPDFLWESGLQDKVQQFVEQRAGEIVQAQLANHQASLFGQQLRQNESGWMFQADPATGQPMRDVQGNPVPTQEGFQVLKTFKELHDSGVPYQAAFDIAKRLVSGQGSLADQAYRAVAPQQAAQTAPIHQQRQLAGNAAFVAQRAAASRQPNRGTPGQQTQPTFDPNAPLEDPEVRMQNLMRARFKERGIMAGVTDD